MANLLNLSEVDCIFISYDEPNAEKNWIDLEEKCFWAQRVHGVKGSDECHKTAANLSNSDWFITVDADNIVDPKFFELTLDLDTFPETVAFSWPGLNIVNGLRYGNGSLKLWRKDYVLGMKTHEAADDDSGQVDFCWEDRYRPRDCACAAYHRNDGRGSWHGRQPQQTTRHHPTRGLCRASR